MLGAVGQPGPVVGHPRVEGLDGVVFVVGIGVGGAQGQGLDRVPGERGFQAVAGGRADVAVEGLERPGGDAETAEIVVRGHSEEGDVVDERSAERAAGSDLLAARCGRLEVLVESAEGVGIVRQLLGAGGQEARPPARVQAEVRDRIPGHAHAARGLLVGVVARQIAEMVGQRAGDVVVAQAEEHAPLGAELEPVEQEGARARLAHPLIGLKLGSLHRVAQVVVLDLVDRLPAEVGPDAQVVLHVAVPGRVVDLDRGARRIVVAMDERVRHGFRVLGLAVERGQGQVEVIGQADLPGQAAREPARLLVFVSGDAVEPEHLPVPERGVLVFGQRIGVRVGQLPVLGHVGAEPVEVEPLGVVVEEVGVAQDRGQLDLGGRVEVELAVEVVRPELRVVAVAGAVAVGAGDAVVQGAGRSAHLGHGLVEAKGPPREISVRRDRPGAAVLGQDAEDAARRGAAVEGGCGTAQDLDAVDGRPVDVEEVGDEARGIVERDAVDQGLYAPRSALGQDALAADREVDALAVGLVVHLDARHELQGLVDGDRPGHRLEDRGLDDRGRARILLERDLDARRGDRDLDLFLGLNRLLFFLLLGGRDEGGAGEKGEGQDGEQRDAEETVGFIEHLARSYSLY